MGVSADQNMRAQNAMNLIWELYFGFDVKNKLVLPVVMVMKNFISVHKVILSYENYGIFCRVNLLQVAMLINTLTNSVL